MNSVIEPGNTFNPIGSRATSLDPDGDPSTGSPLLGFVAMLGLEVALVVGLHAAGHLTGTIPFSGLADWFATADPADALVSIARLVGLAIGYWLLGTTLAYAIAHRLGLDAVAELVGRVTLPAVRQITRGVTAVSITSASLMAPIGLGAGPAFATDSDSPSTVSSTDDGYVPGAAGWGEAPSDGSFWLPEEVSPGGGGAPGPAPAADGAVSAPTTAPAPAPTNNSITRAPTASDNDPADTGSTSTLTSDSGSVDDGTIPYTVVKGDHFWNIAENRMREVVGREVTDDEVADYWLRVVDANRSKVSSGNPDLIFPNEKFTLPPVFG